MINETQLRALISDVENDRVERTVSLDKIDKFCEAICAFSNDLPNHSLPGYFIIGVEDNGTIAGISIGDRDMQRWGAYRSDGNILPVPSYDMKKFDLPEGNICILEVFPSFSPPVKYRGRIYIRIGPRKGIANEGG
jgi:ATP-dependent DNA helicase RecG